MKWLISLTVLSLLLASCKTREDIAREQMVDNLSVQMQDNQKLTAETTTKLQDLEERISKMTGKIEETSHEAKQTFEQRITSLEERIGVLEETNKARSEQIKALQEQMAGQGEYIQQVLKTLNKLSQPKSTKRPAKKLSPYWQAMTDYKDGRYKEAHAGLLKLVDSPSYSGSKKARIIHNLGMIEYMNKDYQNAVTYFSRLYTEYPKTGYNKNGLLYLAKSFEKLKMKDEAKQTLEQLIDKFPKANQVKQAREMLSKL